MWKAIGLLVTPRAAMVCMVVLLLVIVVATFDLYGFSPDAWNGLARAAGVHRFLTSGGTELAFVEEFIHTKFYGAMPDVLALFLQKWLPFLGFDSRHLVAALFGVVGIFYAYRLADYLAGGWAGPVAAALLALNPMWFGYMFINMKDIPFAVGFLALSYHGLRLLADEARPSWRTWLGVGVWSGLLATTKLLGLPMAGVAILVLFVFVWIERRQFSLRAIALRLVGAAGATAVGIVVCSALFWPQLFLYQPDQILQVLRTFLNFTPWNGSVFVDGTFYPADQVPRTYVITYFAISMPLVITALYLLAGPLALWRGRISLLGPVLVPVVFLIVQAVLYSRVYNGYRHFIFLIPFIMIAAGFAISILATISRHFAYRAAVLGLLAVFASTMIYNTVRLFPYQYSSYNLLVGGTSGAQGRYYIDVWKLAVREALQRIEKAAAPDARITVYSCGSRVNFSGLPHVQIVEREQMNLAAFVVALPRHCTVDNYPGYKLVGEVKRGDVVFASILARP